MVLIWLSVNIAKGSGKPNLFRYQYSILTVVSYKADLKETDFSALLVKSIIEEMGDLIMSDKIFKSVGSV